MKTAIRFIGIIVSPGISALIGYSCASAYLFCLNGVLSITDSSKLHIMSPDDLIFLTKAYWFMWLPASIIMGLAITIGFRPPWGREKAIAGGLMGAVASFLCLVPFSLLSLAGANSGNHYLLWELILLQVTIPLIAALVSVAATYAWLKICG